MIVKLQTNEPDGYGGRAYAFVLTEHVIAIEPTTWQEGRDQRYTSRIHLSSGTIINCSLPALYTRAQIWPEER